MIPKLSGLNCPSCGAALEIRSFGNALTVVCPKCLAVLDARDPNLRILQEARSREKITPLIPLGARGTLGGVQYEAIGFQTRTVGHPEESYEWREYLLFNPYHGFRYLTEYNGHWNFVRTAQALPQPLSARHVQYQGESFTRMSSGEARTSYVIGEFPWQVRVDERVEFADYVHPPRLLSSESTPEETVWSLATYMTGAEIWKAFALPGAPPNAIGVFENQPSPHAGDTGGLWKMALWLIAAALLLTAVASAIGGTGDVYAQSLALTHGPAVTAPFDVGGFTSNLQIQTVNRGSESVYVRYSLIHQKTGRATSFGRDVYREDKARVPAVGPGRYYLRVEAERLPASLDISVHRGVPSMGFFWLTLLLLLAPPVAQSWSRLGFERRRWQENS